MAFIVGGDLPQGAKTAWRALVKDTFLTAKKDYEKIATTLPSTTKIQSYDWLYAMPGVVEWLGERRVRAPKFGSTYSLTNRKWENTIGIDQDVIDDDQLGLVTPRIQELGIKAINGIDRLVFQTLAASGTTVGPDGNNFVNDTHAETGSANDNKDTVAFATTGAAATIRLFKQRMLRFTDMDGEPLGISGDLFVGPPELEYDFRTVLYSQYFPTVVPGSATATTGWNIWNGTGDFLVSPWLTDITDFFWAATKMPIKPIILQMRQSPISQELARPSDAAFFQDMNYFGTKARYVCGYSIWQLLIGAIVAG